MGPGHLRAGHRGILQDLHGRQNALPDVPLAVAHPGFGAGQRPGQGRVVPEMPRLLHARIVHVAHLARGVHMHPEHPARGLIGTGRTVSAHGPGADLPGDVHGGPEALGHGQQHLRLVPGQKLHRGAVGPEDRVHRVPFPPQVEGAVVVLRQVVVRSGNRQCGRRCRRGQQGRCRCRRGRQSWCRYSREDWRGRGDRCERGRRRHRGRGCGHGHGAVRGRAARRAGGASGQAQARQQDRQQQPARAGVVDRHGAGSRMSVSRSACHGGGRRFRSSV